MADYREEFQKLLESLYIPIVGDEKKSSGIIPILKLRTTKRS